MQLIPIDMPKRLSPYPEPKALKKHRKEDYQNGTSNEWLDSSKQNKTKLICRGVRKRKKKEHAGLF